MIRKQLKSKDGFTLIELLGTIVIIGIMGTIAVASVINIKNKQNERFDESQVELIKQAGQTYFTDNKRLLPVIEGQTNIVSLKELIDKNYINKVYDSKKQEFNTENDQNGTPNSYVWVQKQESGEYKYEAYCLVNNKRVGTNIPASKANDGTITFTYNGFHDSGNKHYTNGKTENYVQVTINMQKVENYKYEILKDDKQNKVSEVTKAGSGLIKITLKAKDYPEGEYKIKVTTYNDRGTPKSATSQPIYMDKEAPTCDILSDYKPDSNSEDGIWYSSNSVNQNKQKLGTNNKLPIKVIPTDNGSGVKKVTMYSDPGLTTPIAPGGKTAIYEAGNGKRITYYAEVEDNVGNKKTCSKSFSIDTEPPTCDSSGIDGKKGNLVDKIQWYIDKGATPYAYFTDKVSGVDSNIKYGKTITKTSSTAQTGIVTTKDKANNEGTCKVENIYFDNEAPNCSVTESGGTKGNYDQTNKIQWYKKGTSEQNPVKIEGKCSNDVGSGCNLNITVSTSRYKDGTYQITPGTIEDKAGNKRECSSKEVNIDTTPPTCDTKCNSPDGCCDKKDCTATWTNEDVEIKGICDDKGSDCKKKEILKTIEAKKDHSNDISKWISPGTIEDKAGNTTECDKTPVKIDTTPPIIAGCCIYNQGSTTYQFGFSCGTDIKGRTFHGVAPYVYDPPSAVTDNGSVTRSGIFEGSISLELTIGNKKYSEGRSTNNGTSHFCISMETQINTNPTTKNAKISIGNLQDKAGNMASTEPVACEDKYTGGSDDEKFGKNCNTWRDAHSCTYDAKNNQYTCYNGAKIDGNN